MSGFGPGGKRLNQVKTEEIDDLSSLGFSNVMDADEVDQLRMNFNEAIHEMRDLDESVVYSLKETENGFKLIKTDKEGNNTEEFGCAHGKARFRQPVDRAWLTIYLDAQAKAGKDVIVNHCGSADDAITLATVAMDCGVRVKFSDNVLSDLESKREGVISEIKTILGTDDIYPVQRRTSLGR